MNVYFRAIIDESLNENHFHDVYVYLNIECLKEETVILADLNGI